MNRMLEKKYLECMKLKKDEKLYSYVSHHCEKVIKEYQQKKKNIVTRGWFVSQLGW